MLIFEPILPRKRHLVTAVPDVEYAVNYPIVRQLISEIQEKLCAFVEMVKIVCCPSFFYKILFSILICHIFLFLSKNVEVLVSLWLSAFLENPFLNKYSINIFLCMDIHLTGLICHFFRILSKIFIKDRILSENRTIYN